MGLFSRLWARIIGTYDSNEVVQIREIGESSEGSVATLALEKLAKPAAQPPGGTGPQWWAPEGITATEYIEPTRPELNTEARALENLLISHFDGHDLTLPPLLNVAEKVLLRLRDSDCRLADLARDIAEDQVVAAAVLRMANSPLYRGLSKITALPSAVNRLGLQAIRALMVRESMRSAMFHRKGGDNEFTNRIWRRSLASAYIMRRLSEYTDISAEDAFLYGLLHDIGNVVVLRIVLEHESVSRSAIDLATFEYLCWECHQEFGELISRAWKLPDDLTSLVADHHGYPRPDDPLRTERLLIQLTDMIHAMIGYAPSAAYSLLDSRVVSDLGLSTRPGFTAFLDELPSDVEGQLQSM